MIVANISTSLITEEMLRDLSKGLVSSFSGAIGSMVFAASMFSATICPCGRLSLMVSIAVAKLTRLLVESEPVLLS